MPTQYLTRYAETEVALLSDWPDYVYDHVLVLPAYAEPDDFLAELLARAESLLLILVINQPETSPPDADNIALAHRVCQCGSLVWQADNVSAYQVGNKAILRVDRFTQGRQIPIKQGVGLARKIGCDLALALHSRGCIRSPWIYTTDADAHLPADYFQLPIYQGYTAAILPFYHCVDKSSIGRATQQYEQAIRYYARGLAWAGSPYGFTTLGSALAVDAQSYAKVRGFPKRAGGEDFYLLNKLAKIGPILQAELTPIQLAARVSNRIPFGTGPAVKAIIELPEGAPYCYYHPQAFRLLKQWLDAAATLGVVPLASIVKQLPEPAQNALIQLGIETIEQHLNRQSFTPIQAQKALFDWFDGFRTLKFIRHLHAVYPNLPLAECLANGDF